MTNIVALPDNMGSPTFVTDYPGTLKEIPMEGTMPRAWTRATTDGLPKQVPEMDQPTRQSLKTLGGRKSKLTR